MGIEYCWCLHACPHARCKQGNTRILFSHDSLMKCRSDEIRRISRYVLIRGQCRENVVISYLLIPRFESASNRASSKDGFLVSSGDLCLVMYMYTIAKMDLDSTDMVIKDSRYICTLATMMTW